MPQRIRRVVTGHDKTASRIFVMDGKAPMSRDGVDAGVALTDLWQTRTSPASNTGNADRRGGQNQARTPPAGPSCASSSSRPTAVRKSADATKAFASIGAGGAPDHESGDAMMHATATVDYIIVLKGEIWAILDKGEKLLKQGRHPDPARHQPFVERAHQGALRHRRRADRRQAGRAPGAQEKDRAPGADPIAASSRSLSRKLTPPSWRDAGNMASRAASSISVLKACLSLRASARCAAGRALISPRWRCRLGYCFGASCPARPE
jgi:hypothetical protein